MNFKDTTTINLIDIVTNEEFDTSMKNRAAYELACRFYIPNGSRTFEEVLAICGFKDEEPEEEKKRGR
jgi:hypothetical protein